MHKNKTLTNTELRWVSQRAQRPQQRYWGVQRAFIGSKPDSQRLMIPVVIFFLPVLLVCGQPCIQMPWYHFIFFSKAFFFRNWNWYFSTDTQYFYFLWFISTSQLKLLKLYQRTKTQFFVKLYQKIEKKKKVIFCWEYFVLLEIWHPVSLLWLRLSFLCMPWGYGTPQP